MGLDSIIAITISTQTSNPSRTSFGEPMCVAFFPTSVFPGRSRRYSRLTGMISDGFLATDPGYLMAQALKAQNPSVSSWKMGRKALPSVSTWRITPTITTVGEIVSLIVNGTTISYTILAGDAVADIVTALTTLAAAVSGVTAVDSATHMTLTHKNVLTATLTVDGVANAQIYTVTIDGTDFAFTSGGAATATTIRDGLQALIIAGGYAATEVVDNAADALDFAFATHAGADLRETTNGGGATMVLSVEVTANRLLAIGAVSTGLDVQNMTANPGIATDLANIILEDNDFYGVLLDSEAEAEILATAADIEARTKLFVCSNMDSQNKDVTVTTDVGSDLKAAAYARTGILHTEYSSQYGGARWMGKMLPKDPGRATWCFKTLGGLTVSDHSEAEESALNGKYINWYQEVGGINITWEGYSPAGEYLDITQGSDWFRARLQERIYLIQVNNDKVTYTDGEDLYRAAILAQFEEAKKATVIEPNTEDTPWIIDMPTPAEISAAEKANRNYPDIEWQATLAGAVHKLDMTGTLTL